MDDDVRELNEASRRLSKLMMEKIGSDLRPATKADLANFYVGLLLVNDLASALFDLAVADGPAERLEAMKNFRPVSNAMQENFSDAISRLVEGAGDERGSKDED